MTAFNDCLDALPRTRVGSLAREQPVYRVCGVAGFYVAVVVLMGGGLVAGRSPLVLAAVAGVCGLSFYGWTHGRRALTGRETIVALEHVWIALGCAAAVVWLLGEPVLASLDVVVPALATFLAAGRIGCLLVGCCHGRPSSVGIRYGDEAVRDGFPAHLAGIRLFPVQAVEALALTAVGAAGLAALPWAPEGSVLTWFLLAYAVIRFGLEGLRGDERPHVLGLSLNRWLCVLQAGAAVALAELQRGGTLDGPSWLGVLVLLVVLVILAVRRARAARRPLLAPDHLDEVRRLVAELAAKAAPGAEALPAARTSGYGVTVAVSRPPGRSGPLHVSFSLPSMERDLELLCEVAAGSLPQVHLESPAVSPPGILHVLLADVAARAPEAGDRRMRARALYGAVVRGLQSDSSGEPGDEGSRVEYFQARAAVR